MSLQLAFWIAVLTIGMMLRSIVGTEDGSCTPECSDIAMLVTVAGLGAYGVLASSFAGLAKRSNSRGIQNGATVLCIGFLAGSVWLSAVSLGAVGFLFTVLAVLVVGASLVRERSG